MEKPWTKAEDETLLEMKSQYKSYDEIGQYLGRSGQSVRGRYRRLPKGDCPEEIVRNYRTYPHVNLSAAVFDIETTNFVASGARNHMVCCSILPLATNEPYTIAIEFQDHRDDRRILEETLRELSKFDILIGHNISAFDSGWLGTRLAYHGMSIPSHRWLLYDTYQASRRMAIKADRKSMAFLCDFFRVEYVKTAILPVSWGMIDSYDRNEFEVALDDIVYHCETDVLSNRSLFDALWPLDRTMTNMPVAKRI